MRKERESLKENEKLNLLGKRIITIIKLILVAVALVLSYLISDKIIDYILTIDAIMLKRILNVILVIIVLVIAMRKK